MGGYGVDKETVLHHLEEIAEKLGIDVRYESAAGRVGMGMLRGRRVAVIDSNLRVTDRVAALCTILAGEELGDIYLPPAVRKRIDASSPLRVRPETDECEPGAAEEVARAAAQEQAEEASEMGDGADPEIDPDH